MIGAPPSRPQGQARWNLFLRAFAKEVDESLKASFRDALLRRAGAQVAHDLALPPVHTVEELEGGINGALVDLGWGQAHLEFDEASRLLSIVHTRLPSFEESEGECSSWFPAVLEGLYTAWLGQQTDAGNMHFAARRTTPPQANGAVTLVYGHSKWIETSASGNAPPTSTSHGG